MIQSLHCTLVMQEGPETLTARGVARSKRLAVVLRIAESRQVHVADARFTERGGQLPLGHARFSGQRRQSYVHEDRDRLSAKLVYEFTDGSPLIPKTDQRWPAHLYDAATRRRSDAPWGRVWIGVLRQH